MQNYTSSKPAQPLKGLENAPTIPQASCPLPKLYSFKTQAEIVPEAASVHPASQKCTISVPP